MNVEDGISNPARFLSVQFAELTGVRVISLDGRCNFPVNHPQYLYDINLNDLSTRKLLERSSVVVAGHLFFTRRSNY